MSMKLLVLLADATEIVIFMIGDFVIFLWRLKCVYIGYRNFVS